MMMRSACFLLVFSLGLSACVRPISKSPVEYVAPMATLEEGQAAGLTSTLPLSVMNSDSPDETGVVTDIVQTQSEPAPEQEVVSSNTGSVAMPPYILQSGTPRFMANFIQPEAGCNWMGVGGQAFTLGGQPVTRLVVEVGGTLAGSDVFHLELTGNQTTLGAGGYLITLSDRPIASTRSLWILLYDLAGVPLTYKIYFSTVQDCASNFILINFIEANPNSVPQVWLPMIGR